MAWTIEIGHEARKAFRHIAKADVDRITRYIDNLTSLDDPRLRGSALVGGLQGLWRYRVGDYRIICRFEHGLMVVLVVQIGHRREVYG